MTPEELQEKLASSRVPVEALELEYPVGYVYDEAGIVVWNNIGVVLLCRQHPNSSAYVVDLQIYSGDHGWSRACHKIVGKYRLKRTLDQFTQRAQYVAKRRAAGWTMQGSPDDNVEIVVVNPIDQARQACAWGQVWPLLKKLPVSPVQAVLEDKTMPAAVQQAIAATEANQYQTEVDLLAARHHDVSELVACVQSMKLQQGQSLLAAVEKAHPKQLTSAS